MDDRLSADLAKLNDWQLALADAATVTPSGDSDEES